MQLCSASWLQSIMTSAHVPETMSGGKSVGGGDCMASQGMSPCTQMHDERQVGCQVGQWRGVLCCVCVSVCVCVCVCMSLCPSDVSIRQVLNREQLCA